MDDVSADLRSLFDRLKEAQHALIEEAARQPGLPSTAVIRRIAELENTIAAVLALIEELRPFSGAALMHPAVTPCCERTSNGDWYREVVQRTEGLRLHSARPRWEGCVRAHQRRRALRHARSR